MFAPMYECRSCGDVWQVEVVEDIDCDRDSIECRAVCACGRDVTPKFVESEGGRIPVWHALTDDELMSELEELGGE